MTSTAHVPPLGVRRFALRFVISAFFLSSSLTHADPKAEVSVVGPIERLDCLTRDFVVLGVKFRADLSSAFDQICGEAWNSASLYVAVRGAQNGDSYATPSHLMLVGTESYVAGATTVFIRGLVTASKPETGDFSVSGAWVRSDSGLVPDLNEMVEVLGTQPVLNGRVIAASFSNPQASSGSRSVAKPTVESSAIIGSGKSVSAIIGSGKATSAIIGSGKATSAIIGSGRATYAIIGSGRF